MNQQWYQVMSLLYGYAAAAAIVLTALLALRGLLSDARLLRRVRKHTPQAGAAGTLCVLSAGTRRLAAGQEIRVPYEGTMGASHSCDVCIPFRRVHMRSAFFWMEKDGLHMMPLHKDGFFVDEEPVNPGDEAVLRDGAVLRVRELRLRLTLYPWAYDKGRSAMTDPYVTTARRSRARQGHGEGIGAPGKGEIRREKKLRRRQDAQGAKKNEKTPSGKGAKTGADAQKKKR